MNRRAANANRWADTLEGVVMLKEMMPIDETVTWVLKWRTKHFSKRLGVKDKALITLAAAQQKRALDGATLCANCGHPKSAHWHRDCGGAYEFANCGGVFDDICDCKKYLSERR